MGAVSCTERDCVMGAVSCMKESVLWVLLQVTSYVG